jgi:hypothetical protein
MRVAGVQCFAITDNASVFLPLICIFGHQCKCVFLGGGQGEGLGFELRASCLQSRCSNAWAVCTVHFGLVILEMGVFQIIYLGWPLSSGSQAPEC